MKHNRRTWGEHQTGESCAFIVESGARDGDKKRTWRAKRFSMGTNMQEHARNRLRHAEAKIKKIRLDIRCFLQFRCTNYKKVTR